MTSPDWWWPRSRKMVRLGVNIDHVATVRQARGEGVPDLLEAARIVAASGADGITVHLREDRRHIQDSDVFQLKRRLRIPLNLEMALVPDVIRVALKARPAWVCLVPEKREELTTEGGLRLDARPQWIRDAIRKFHNAGIRVSLFIEPEIKTVVRAARLGADAVELHTGLYARTFAMPVHRRRQTKRIIEAACAAAAQGLIVNAGHGLTYDNVKDLLKAFRFHEFNIGFSIVARSLFVGLPSAVKEMKKRMRA